MPILRNEVVTTSGEKEQVVVTTLSELLLSDDYFDAKGELIAGMDMIVIAIPDTGNGAFNGSHEIKTGKQAGKMSKATFVVAELGSSFAGEASPYSQSQGDVAGLPLSIKLSVTATPPNRDGKTVNEALNRTVKTPGAVIEAAKANGDSKVIQ